MVVTVIDAVPADTAVTNPLEETVATDVLLLLHETFLFVALAGMIVATNWLVSPTFSDKFVAFSDTLATEYICGETVT
jgi:hypothetical protein